MTPSQLIAERIEDAISPWEEAEALNSFAVQCELAAGEWGVTFAESQILLKRADHYRMLQLMALAKMAELESEETN
jgi:hypothetical protein